MDNIIIKNNSRKSVLEHFLGERMIKKLLIHSQRIDISDNNEKAEMVKDLLGPDFVELGTGTNRIAFLKNGLVIKIALDRRGFVDNWTEFKRSDEMPQFLALTYESNIVCNLMEYVSVMDQEQFRRNETGIKRMLAEIAKDYWFDDIGFNLKNYCNIGYRVEYGVDVDEDSASIVVLDYGYLKPKKNQIEAFTCPHCSGLIKNNTNYTGYICAGCNVTYTCVDIDRRRKVELDDYEDRMIHLLRSGSMEEISNMFRSNDRNKK